MNRQKNKKDKRRFDDFDAIKVALASPEQILSWSHGEVTEAETINYRTMKPEVDGLMCEKIFGPSKNYQCYCGKYRKVRYKGIVCDKCGVQVTTSRVRRERMGHIKLAVPVTHVWFAYSIPNKISMILDIPQKKILSVIYYTRYMVTEIDGTRKKEILPIIDQELESNKEELNEELEEEIEKLQEALDKKIDTIKEEEDNEAKAEFKIETLQHDNKKKVAALHKEFAERETKLEKEYAALSELVERIEVGEVLTEDELIKLKRRNFLFFSAKMGAEAIKKLLAKLDLEAVSEALRKEISTTNSKSRRRRIVRRLKLIDGMKKNNIHPEWCVLDVLPVIPPDLRPIIQLPGGKFATSDLNDLYRRVINRNNRLKRLIKIGAPEVILRNEKRMLQESVDALIDNSHRPSRAITNLRKMPYKALTDNLRGKKGRFRRNLLGKRVDYSGRAVIIGSHKLQFNQCGLPKTMALEMFKPFVIRKLLEAEEATNIRMAKQIIEAKNPIVWDMVEEIIEDRPVLLNRAPTLHKQGIQAFYPILVEGNAIRIHPLICAGFNADFDGDMMALHIPLSEEAVEEAKNIMLAKYNVISQADGSVLAIPTKDMNIGHYLLNRMEEEGEEIITYPNPNRAISAYNIGGITLSQKIAVNIKDEKVETSVGRLIFNEALPDDFRYINKNMDKGALADVIKEVVRHYPLDESIDVLDKLKLLGFEYATKQGYDLAVEDFEVDVDRKEMLEKGDKKEMKLQQDYMMGLLTYDEKRQLSIDMWNDITSDMGEKIWERIKKDNPVYQQIMSGAGKYPDQARQIIAMKGMIRDPSGKWVELPIKGNHSKGLSAFEYFAASRGARKGLADTALRTASSGYLTRKLVDVAQDLIIRTEDCGFEGEGHTIVRDDEMSTRRVPFVELIQGRWTAQEVKDPKSGDVLIGADEEITMEIAEEINEAGVQEVNVRSPLTCQAPLGLCAKCYGYDIGRNEPVKVGKAVGVIAAQSMGEPATQMVLRTFHSGGAAETDITRGLPRLTELFEARDPKKAAFIMPFDGTVEIEEREDGNYELSVKGQEEVQKTYYMHNVKELNVEDGDEVKDGEVMYVTMKEKERQAPFAGKVSIIGNIFKIEGKMEATEEFTVPSIYKLLVEDGDEVKAGKQLTDGNIDPETYAEIVGLLKTQEYIVDGAQQVYTEQGIAMDDKHVECIVRQMGRMAKVLDPGSTDYLMGSLVNKYVARIKNDILEDRDLKRIYLRDSLLGITAASLKTESFLSAMSFQEQVRVLTEASVIGKVDYLRGLKENVIIGRPIPVNESARIEDFMELEEFKDI
jgi:DNA-directed RNA polymerase subunit beta'